MSYAIDLNNRIGRQDSTLINQYGDELSCSLVVRYYPDEKAANLVGRHYVMGVIVLVKQLPDNQLKVVINQKNGDAKEFTFDQYLNGGIGIYSGLTEGRNRKGFSLTDLHYLSHDYLRPGDFFGYDAGNDSVLLAN
jgi:hypothetical protein